MSELINRWFSRTPRLQGMAACGICFAEGAAFSKSWEAQHPDGTLDELWSRLNSIAKTAEAGSAEKLKWTFERGVVLGATRTNGPIFFVLLSQKTDEKDISGVERLLAEFRALRG